MLASFLHLTNMTSQFWFLLALICISVQVYLYLHLVCQNPAAVTNSTKCSQQSVAAIIPNCPEDEEYDFRQGRHFYQRGNYTILFNYIESSESVPFKGSVTIATHATLGFLEYIQPLVDFWAGPISVAVFAPGSDFGTTLSQIAFLRNCAPNGHKVKARVTFHIIFPTLHLPMIEPSQNLFDLGLPKLDCSRGFPNSTNFRKEKKLLFPINVARNVAREGATTYFVLVNDIELFPNPPDLIPKFLKMIQRHEKDNPRFLDQPQVFVLPPFEVKLRVKLEDIPRNKTQLLEMVETGTANKFHKFACDICHRIPQRLEWINSSYLNESSSNELNIFYTSDYISKFAWEPFYIGMHADPPFDERIHRELALNKVIQANALCHLGYRFHVLDNAFLVHRPGIRFGASSVYSMKKIGLNILRSKVRPLQKVLYGQNKKCF